MTDRPLARSTIALLLHLLLFCLVAGGASTLCAQSTNPQQMLFSGLSSLTGQGEVDSLGIDASGNLFLLLDQGDGVRLVKTDPRASSVLAQAHLGAAGDEGVAMALDSAGNVYITGVTASGALAGTAGAAFPSRTDSSLNSFVARLDNSLNLGFLSFTGGSRIESTAIAVSSDAVFVTGYTYGADLPVTASAIGQQPAYASEQNGFVERFSLDGRSLVYATYLTGANGSTTPAAIAVDGSGRAIVAGQTSATGFPTVNALIPLSLSNPSGFLVRLSPAADGILASTFIPGDGLTSLALDSTGQVLLASGSVALGQFPVGTVTMPLVSTSYQVLLRLPLDLSSVLSSTLIAPGSASTVTAGPGGSAWVGGDLTLPLLPLPAASNIGDTFVAQVAGTSPYQVTTDLRLGGVADENLSYASLSASISALSVDSDGELFAGGMVAPTASSSLLASETYDLPLLNTPTPALPSTLAQAKATAATCGGSLCAGGAAFLTKVAPSANSTLVFSTDDAPFVVLRNLGSVAASSISLSVSSGSFATNCGSTLLPGDECDLLLSGGMAGSVAALYANANTGQQTSTSATFGTYPAPTTGIVFSPKELDFGIVSAAGTGQTRTFTVSNLGTTARSFTSAALTYAGVSSPFTQTASTCPSQGSSYQLAPGTSCEITLSFTANTASSEDGFVSAQWSLGLPSGRNLALTAYSQAAALSLSATEVDFGTQIAGKAALPRFLYLSNSSTGDVAHTAVTTASGSPFTVTDHCGATLAPASVCQIKIDYASPTAPSNDSVALALDAGLSVLVTGQTLPPAGVTGATVNANLTVTPNAVTFPTPVVVTSTSAEVETVSITNSGTAPFTLAVTLTGDYTDTTSCGATLAGGATCAVALRFVPGAPGTRNGLLSITAGSGTALNVPITGTATAILATDNNGALSFPATIIGEPSVQSFAINGQLGALTASASGPFAVVLVPDTGFGFGAPTTSAYSSSVTGVCQSCYLGVQFLPGSPGPQTGTLTLTSSSGGTPYMLQLTGTGLANSGLILSPGSASFASVPAGSQGAPQRFTLTNLLATGSAASLGAPAVSGNFAFVSDSANPATCGATLAYGASCLLEVAFAPTAAGTEAGSLTVAGATASLIGTGTPTPALTLNPAALRFENAPGARATVQAITATNTSSAPLTLGAPTTGTTSFQVTSNCGTLAPAASCSLSVAFTPGAATVADTLTLPVTQAGQTTTTTAALTGDYTASSAGLQLFPAQANFSPAATGTAGGTQLFTASNFTATALTLSTNYPRQFAPASAPCTTLAPGASCNFAVTFVPATNGAVSGSIVLQATPTTGGAPLTAIAYAEGYGTGTGGLAVSGALLADGVYNFGQVVSGQSSSVTFTLTNSNATGASAVTVRRVSSQPPFLSTTTCGAALGPGQSCTVTVTYSPVNQVSNTSGDATNTYDQGILMIENDAATAPTMIDLTGAGAPVVSGSSAAAQPLATFTLSEGSLTFPATAVGEASASQAVTLTNTGSATLHILSAMATPDFTMQSSCATVAPAETCTITVASTPQSVGAKLATLEIASDAATSLEFVSLVAQGLPATLALTPTTLDFGSVQVGNASTLAVAVSNPGNTPIQITSLLATGNFSAGGSCEALLQAGQPLAANATCTAQVTFTPTTTGPQTGTLSLASSATTLPLTVALSGMGIQSQLVVAPSALSFGSIVLGVPANLTLTLTNAGTAPITHLTLSTTGDFAVTIPCPSATLLPGAVCTVQVTFTASALGLRSGALTVTSSDPSSPLAIPLSGTGVQSGSFTLMVDGASAASATVSNGVPAIYTLTATPLQGFSGSLALTCAPVSPAPYATCSLNPATLNLANGTQTATATLTTVTSTVPEVASARLGALWLLTPLLLFLRRRGSRRALPPLLAACLIGALLTLSGCGSSSNPNLRYTPAGTYQYQVTAASTSGVPVSQTVTLNLTVAP